MSAREKAALLAHWLAQHKTTARERDEAKDALETWFKRAKLALDKGELELARAAKDKAAEAREAYRVATARLVEIDTELSRVRGELAAPDTGDSLAAHERAAQAAEEFRKLGIDPRFAAMEEAGYGRGLDSLTGDTGAPPASVPTGVAPTDPSEPPDAWAEADALLDEPLDPELPPAPDEEKP